MAGQCSLSEIGASLNKVPNCQSHIVTSYIIKATWSIVSKEEKYEFLRNFLMGLIFLKIPSRRNNIKQLDFSFFFSFFGHLHNVLHVSQVFWECHPNIIFSNATQVLFRGTHITDQVGVVPIRISEKCRKNCKHCYYSEQIKFFLHVCRFFSRPKLASTYACYQVDAKYRF